MSHITNIGAYEILDSRGHPTLMVTASLSSGASGQGMVPSGASTGAREAFELRDHDAHRYHGQGVLKAVSHVNGVIRSALLGKNPAAQEDIDQLLMALDGTDNKSKLGANAILGVSLAVANAVAQDGQMPLYRYLGGDGPFSLPVPMMNIINGGKHADNNLDFQEFMIVPAGLPSFEAAVRCGAEIFHTLQRLLKKQGLVTAVGDEGGFAPSLSDHEAAFSFILEAVIASGYHPGRDVFLAIDAASSELYQSGRYQVGQQSCSSEALIQLFEQWVKDYPIISIEDGLSESDWEGWKLLTQRLGHKIQLVGDDIFVTNPKILKEGANLGIANAILVKPNQIGTLTETCGAIALAKSENYGVIISHRSGETEDTTIADLAVATAAGQIKAGSLSRSDRVAKYNRLLGIARELGDQAPYAGSTVFPSV